MMEVTLFGIGAAGNKAAINVLEKGVLDSEHVFMLNTTLKDVPDQYKINNDGHVIKFSSMLGGCGKEPAKGMSAMVDAISTGAINFGSMISPSTKSVVIVTSIEGGTGSGSTPVMVKYFEALNLPVHVFAFVGFQDDARGISNSLKFFKNLGDNVILHTILNDRFLDYTDTHSKAEAAANDEFARQLKVLIGSNMIPCRQNIDDTDHYKILTTPGYMDIIHISLDKLKNTESVNGAIINKMDEPTCLDYPKGCKRLAVIVNASERVQEAIDDNFTVIRRYTGEPYEVYRHIQSNTVDTDEYMDIIVAGLAFPEQGIVDMNKRYVDVKSKLGKDVKGLSDIFSNLDFDDSDEDQFNTDLKTIKNPDDIKKDFANMFGIVTPTKKDNTVKTPVSRTVTTTKNNKTSEY